MASSPVRNASKLQLYPLYPRDVLRCYRTLCHSTPLGLLYSYILHPKARRNQVRHEIIVVTPQKGKKRPLGSIRGAVPFENPQVFSIGKKSVMGDLSEGRIKLWSIHGKVDKPFVTLKPPEGATWRHFTCAKGAIVATYQKGGEEKIRLYDTKSKTWHGPFQVFKEQGPPLVDGHSLVFVSLDGRTLYRWTIPQMLSREEGVLIELQGSGRLISHALKRLGNRLVIEAKSDQGKEVYPVWISSLQRRVTIESPQRGVDAMQKRIYTPIQVMDYAFDHNHSVFLLRNRVSVWDQTKEIRSIEGAFQAVKVWRNHLFLLREREILRIGITGNLCEKITLRHVPTAMELLPHDEGVGIDVVIVDERRLNVTILDEGNKTRTFSPKLVKRCNDLYRKHKERFPPSHLSLERQADGNLVARAQSNSGPSILFIVP